MKRPRNIAIRQLLNCLAFAVTTALGSPVEDFRNEVLIKDNLFLTVTDDLTKFDSIRRGGPIEPVLSNRKLFYIIENRGLKDGNLMVFRQEPFGIDLTWSPSNHVVRTLESRSRRFTPPKGRLKSRGQDYKTVSPAGGGIFVNDLLTIDQEYSVPTQGQCVLSVRLRFLVYTNNAWIWSTSDSVRLPVVKGLPFLEQPR